MRPAHTRAYADCRRQSSNMLNFTRPAQTSAGIPTNHESAPRSPSADSLFCIGTYADVYRCIRSPIYTFIHGATCAMQWRRAGSCKPGHLSWLLAAGAYACMKYKPGLPVCLVGRREHTGRETVYSSNTTKCVLMIWDDDVDHDQAQTPLTTHRHAQMTLITLVSNFLPFPFVEILIYEIM